MKRIRGLGILIVGAIAACSPTPDVAPPESAASRYDDTPIIERPATTPTQGELPVPPTATSTVAASPLPQPSDVPMPDLSLVENWQTLQGNGVRLDVPIFYDGGNPATEYDALLAKLTAIHPNYGERLQSIAMTPDAIALIAFDVQNTESDFLTNINIATEAVEPDVTIEAYMQAASQHLAQAYTIQSQSLVSVNGYRAGQIVGAIRNNAVEVKQLFYMIPHNGRVWIVTYATTAAEFDQRLPEFTQSIQTIAFELDPSAMNSQQ